jgi:flagellar export protein FliJ
VSADGSTGRCDRQGRRDVTLRQRQDDIGLKRFVFRAQVALDLRLKQDEEARRALAVAESLARDARASLEAAERLLNDMLQRGGDARAAEDVAASIWYRNWLVGQHQRIERCRLILREREQAVSDAVAHAQLARRKAKSLERFREHAWQRYTREERREEQKVLDELGGVRYVLARETGGGDR